jgi:hypothetical protein
LLRRTYSEPLRAALIRLVPALFAAAAVHVLAADPLPAMAAEVSNVTVSGLSSGAYMAVQVHVAHSALVKGVGALAGGPYYCAKGSVWSASFNCMTPGRWTPLPSIAALRTEVEALASAAHIDSPANLASARVWLFSGTQDRTVLRPVVMALRDFYASYGVQPVVLADKPAGHAMVTEAAGSDCATTAAPYINDCDFDAAGELLKHLLGPLAPASVKPGGRLLHFDQRPFASGARMDEAGYVYLPQSCQTERCRLHVAFHGCRQGAEAIGDQFAREAGYNRWADTNRLIVLYPQTVSSYSWFGFNPRGCWDWWGYTGRQYHTRDGAQIRAVKAMLDRLGEPRP